MLCPFPLFVSVVSLFVSLLVSVLIQSNSIVLFNLIQSNLIFEFCKRVILEKQRQFRVDVYDKILTSVSCSFSVTYLLWAQSGWCSEIFLCGCQSIDSCVRSVWCVCVCVCVSVCLCLCLCVSLILNGSRYSRMDQVKLWKAAFKKLKWYGLPKQTVRLQLF